VTDGLPLAVYALGDAEFITTSVGRAFKVYDVERMHLAFTGPRLNEKIRALLVVGEVVLTALQSDIVAWYKLTELGRLCGHTSSASLMSNIGEGYLVSTSGKQTLVWRLSDISTGSESSHRLGPIGEVTVEDGLGEVTALCHPPTYLHKMLIGGTQGLCLWNVRSMKRVHIFGAVAGRCDAISCMREAPHVLDHVAVGYASGKICLLNIREDQVVLELHQAQGRVMALTFRTGFDAPEHLVSAASNGAFVVWDLHKKRAHHVEDAHRGPITSAMFLERQPILVTGARDNSIREWIFDTADGFPRLLRFRSGCAGPARWMRFYGDGDRQLLIGGGLGSIHGGFVSKISMIQEQQNIEFSQSSIKKFPGVHSKLLPPVVDMATCEVRHFDWPAVVSAHENTDAAYLWSAFNQSLAPVRLCPPDTKGAVVTKVAISPCGNFSVVGLSNGSLHKFNLQSQTHRGAFALKDEPARHAHRGAVCGLSITVSGLVLSSSSHPEDCRLRVWNLKTQAAVISVLLSEGRPESPTCLHMRDHGALVAVALDDGALQVVDLHGNAIVRSFVCSAPVVDLAFTPEGRWLAAALRGGGLR
jgi:U3 small nucleolar RNA-associated protein 21